MDIESIIKSLENAENDNRKFALLLILSELIKTKKLDELKSAENAKSQELNKRLFKSIGANFLARLITTSQSANNCSPLLYKSVAMSILTQFLEYPSIMCDPVLLSKISMICEILSIQPKHEPDSEDFNNNRKNLILDTFKYLFTLNKYCSEFLCSNVSLPDILMKKVILNENFADSKSFQNKNFTNLKEDLNENLLFVGCKLFSSICGEIGSESRFNSRVIQCLKELLNATNNHQGEFKFCLINSLNYFLEDEHVGKYFIDEHLSDEASELIFKVINDLFKSKVNKSVKELAFVLLKNFVKFFNFEFIYMKNRNFFYLIIHLLCIEVGFNLETSNKSENNQFFGSLTDTMSVYYSLLEEIIIILSTASPFDTKSNKTGQTEHEDQEEKDEDEDEDLNYEPEFKKVIKILVEVLQSIISFVKDELNNFKVLGLSEKILLTASIRLLICWMAHESILEQDLLDLMPKMLDFAEFNQSLDSNEKVNVFEFLLPGLQRVLIDRQDRVEFLNSKKVKTQDKVKMEFEINEIAEQINSIEEMLNVCYKHT